MAPSLSIIVPCHNVAQKLNAVEALKTLRGEVVEAIFVDDGSTDQTAAMLEKLELAIAKTLLRSSNRGPGAARNLGLDAAKGEYVWFIDADDRPVPEPVLCRLPEILRTMPDTALFQGTSCGERLVSRWSKSTDMYERFASYGMVPSKLFRRRFLEENAIRFPDSYSCEDNAFVLEAGELQSSATIYDDVVYEVLLTGDSISRGSFNPAFITRWRAVRQMATFAHSHPRAGLRELERELVFLSLSLTWSYYLERGRIADLVPQLPHLLASLRAWQLLKHLDVFLRSGSAANRAAKLAAVALALPLSLMVKPAA